MPHQSCTVPTIPLPLVDDDDAFSLILFFDCLMKDDGDVHISMDDESEVIAPQSVWRIQGAKADRKLGDPVMMRRSPSSQRQALALRDRRRRIAVTWPAG